MDNVTKWIVAPSQEEALKIAEEKYGKDIQVHQDTDVLDTWFSSALLPLSALGWPTKVKLIS